MLLREIEIVGYRGFSQPETLFLAAPTGAIGSGLTIVVGPNNAGKSSFVEALMFLRSPGRDVPLAEGQKNAVANGRVEIRYKTDQGEYRLTSAAGGTAIWAGTDAAKAEEGQVLVLSARRNIEAQFQVSGQSRKHYIQNSPDFTSRKQITYGFADRLTAIESNRTRFRELLHRVLPDAPDWYIEKSDQGHSYVKVTSGPSPHNGDGLGQGVLAVLHILDALYDSEPGEVIVIDEPELSLHPAAQRRLALVLAEYAADRQLIVATHSPYFVGLEFLVAGAAIARLSLDSRRVRIGQLTAETVRKIVPLLGDRNNPHVFGLDAREVFFLEDNVLLVEGQEDVVGYRALFTQLGTQPQASFFGWGVGGAMKMPAIAAVLHDLRVTRVVGLLDAGQEQIAATLRSTFPEYMFLTIPAMDIRDKADRVAFEARKGLLGPDGNVHAEYLPQAREILNKVVVYLSSEATKSA